MKKNTWCFLSVILCAMVLFSNSGIVKEADKVALVIGVSSYPSNSGWNKINGENDVLLIRRALEARGFLSENIYELKGNQATKKNIIDKLEEITSKISKEGFFVFHFSGHGQQLQDVEPNKDEIDDLDETIIPFDAEKAFIPNVYEGQNHFIDDDMDRYFLPIRKKIGQSGQILLLIDACHSGTVTRNDDQVFNQQVRGTNEVFLLEEEPVLSKPSNEKTGYLTAVESDVISKMIVISATRSQELNKEYYDGENFYGPLSYSFAKVFPTIGKHASYQLFFEKLRAEMLKITDNQAPTFDGDMRLVLGQNVLNTVDEYFLSLRIENNQELTIDGGSLQNVYKGSELDFYPLEIDTVGQIVAKGIVIEHDLFTSLVRFKINKGKSIEDIKKAYVTRYGFDDSSVSVSLDIKNQALRSALEKKIENNDLVNKVEKFQEIRIVQQKNKLEVIDENGVLQTYDFRKNDFETLSKIIVEEFLFKFFQNKFLSSLRIEAKPYKLKGRLVLVDLGLDITGGIVKAEPIPDDQLNYNSQGILEVPLESFYQLEITNEGDRNAYLTVLDFQPDGVFNIAIPFPHLIEGKKYQVEDYLIKKGEKKILRGHYWKMGLPKGIEQYSIIGTNQPINLEHIENTRGDNNSNNPFEELLNQRYKIYHESTRTGSERPSPLVPTEVNIEVFFIEIVDAKQN